MNSKAILKYLDWISAKLDETGWRWFKQYVETFPIPSATQSQKTEITGLVDEILTVKKENSNADTAALETQIDVLVYRLYSLTDEEIAVVGQG